VESLARKVRTPNLCIPPATAIHNASMISFFDMVGWDHPHHATSNTSHKAKWRNHTVTNATPTIQISRSQKPMPVT
jgi:hypothetical protein